MILLFAVINCLKIWSCLFFLVIPGNHSSQANLQGEHKICEDIELKQKQKSIFTLQFDKVHQLIQITGPLDIGLLTAFKLLYQTHPDTTGVRLNSKGGNIYQARGLAQIILQYKLNTYVFGACYSACTIAYIAGTIRYLGPNAKLGFHQYAFNSILMNPNIDLKKEQDKDIAYFKTRIDDKKFIEQIFDSECTTIWIPDNNELLNAGVVHEVIKESTNKET